MINKATITPTPAQIKMQNILAGKDVEIKIMKNGDDSYFFIPVSQEINGKVRASRELYEAFESLALAAKLEKERDFRTGPYTLDEARIEPHHAVIILKTADLEKIKTSINGRVLS